MKLVDEPKFGEEVASCHPSEDTMNLLLTRRSTAADLLGAPGPSKAELDAIILAARRVPDHRCVVPFRFIVIEGEGRKSAGTVLRTIFEKDKPETEERLYDYEAKRFMRAPTILVVVAAIDGKHKTPVWEQTLTVGAVCQNALIACNASGFAAQWLTEWYAFDETFKKSLGLAEAEQFAGFIYIGTANQKLKERRRPDVQSLVSTYGA